MILCGNPQPVTMGGPEGRRASRSSSVSTSIQKEGTAMIKLAPPNPMGASSSTTRSRRDLLDEVCAVTPIWMRPASSSLGIPSRKQDQLNPVNPLDLCGIFTI